MSGPSRPPQAVTTLVLEGSGDDNNVTLSLNNPPSGLEYRITSNDEAAATNRGTSRLVTAAEGNPVT